MTWSSPRGAFTPDQAAIETLAGAVLGEASVSLEPNEARIVVAVQSADSDEEAIWMSTAEYGRGPACMTSRATRRPPRAKTFWTDRTDTGAGFYSIRGGGGAEITAASERLKKRLHSFRSPDAGAADPGAGDDEAGVSS
ncbi:MAG: hypothetical protein GX147_02955 [Deltaproteobacteria bacterium]|nr:hypothetical protein [Deltaproteobacteria bacterium]